MPVHLFWLVASMLPLEMPGGASTLPQRRDGVNQTTAARVPHVIKPHIQIEM